MTPKEKARDLVERFDETLTYLESKAKAKQCALICVDEKQETIDKMFNGYHTMPEEWRREYNSLEEVKQEINNL